MKGYKVRLQRFCFADVEVDVPDDMPPGQVAADVIGAVLAGAMEAEWQVAPLSQGTVLVKGVSEIAASSQLGRDALTTGPDLSGDYDEDDDGGVPVEDISIPPDGLDIDDGEPQIPLDGLDAGDDIQIPADGLPLTDAQVAELERHETGAGEDEEEPF